MKNLKTLVIIVFLVVTITEAVSAANSKFSQQIRENTYSFYEEYFSDKNENDPNGITKARQWVAKAKREKEYNQIIKGFRVLMFIDKKDNLLAYSDSIVHFAKLSTENKLIGNAYLTRGIVYYNQKELVHALDNYIVADKFISQTSDQYMLLPKKRTTF
jgi:hypothetical protein